MINLPMIRDYRFYFNYYFAREQQFDFPLTEVFNEVLLHSEYIINFLSQCRSLLLIYYIVK